MPVITALTLGALTLLAMPGSAHAQVDAIRRARETVRDRLPSLASLFGDTPALTTSIEDGKDGVALLDDFNPEWYSPLQEMPRGPEGSILLSPGAYVMVVESFCLHPGTFGPHLGEGYLHTEWKGPRAELVRNILGRYPDHPEVTQQQAQLLLWAVISRTKFETLRADVKAAAARLLTPAELTNLAGYGLDAVENGVRDRVLATLPTPVRRVYEAENDLRRMLARADAEYAEMERTAVREGRVPLEESIFTLPDTRWSYHPNGFFVRYLVRTYKETRVDVYMPETIQIGRDASGRIISIKSPDGRQLEPVRQSRTAVEVTPSLFRTVSWGGSDRDVSASRVPTLRAAALGWAGDARDDLLDLARADVIDLVSMRGDVLRVMRARGDSSRARDLHLITEAVHAAVGRFIGLSRIASLPSESSLASSLRPVATLGGFTYDVAPVAFGESAPAQGYRQMKPFPPNQGGASGAGSRQRIGPTTKSKNSPSNAPGRNPAGPAPATAPAAPDALDKAQQITSWFGAAMDAFGAMTDPAGFVGGQMQGQMLGAGMDAAFSASRQISNSLGGGDDDDHDAPAISGPMDRIGGDPGLVLIPASWTGTWPLPRAATGRQGGATDFRRLVTPRVIQFAPATPGAITPSHANAVTALLASTFRMVALLEAVVSTRERLQAAVTAQDVEWQDAQAKAVVQFKRQAGLEMVQFSRDLEVLLAIAEPSQMPTEAEARQAHQQLSTDGWTPGALDVYRQLGRTDAEIEAARRRLLSTDPRAAAESFVNTMRELREAAWEYGAYLALLPEIPTSR